MLKRYSTFSLDTANQSIWRGQQRIQLAPKAFAVFSYLVNNPGRIVTKEELLNAAWPDTFVQEAVLKTCVLEIRKALAESSKACKCIDTVHRRGYRFVDRALEETAVTGLLGRGADLRRLHALLDRARAGERQVVFVTGEPGIGKSTLIAHFLKEAAGPAPVQILRGYCIEHFGAREPYYPVFDALVRVAKEGSVARFFDVLRTYAPTWLVEMPGVAPEADREALKQETLGATRERMLREMTAAIEALAAEDPLVLVLEDLHWSDVSTLDLVSWLANRTESARLLLIASYRPIEVILTDHPLKPLKQGLLSRQRCVELELELLSEREITDLLSARFPRHGFPDDFADLVHAHTAGNPLFVTNVLDYAASRSMLSKDDGTWRLTSALSDFALSVPESLSQMIERQVERLTPKEQAVLELAGVIGPAFTVALLAGDDPAESDAVETCCDQMVKRNLVIRSAGVAESAPGLVSARYRFTHALYRDIFYKRLSPGRRIRLHRIIGERLESAFAGRLNEAASELALHFQECHDAPRAIRYLRLLAQRCAGRHALREALEALMRAMSLVPSLPNPAKAKAEFELAEQLGLVYRLMGQLAASAAEFEKMYQHAHRAGTPEGRLQAQLWLASVVSWVDRDRCLAAVDTILSLCGSVTDARLCVNARGQVAYWNLLFRGWDAQDALASVAALDAARESGDSAAIALHSNRHSFFQCLSSQYRDACDTAAEGVRTAIRNENLLDYSIGHFFEAWALLHLGEWGRMRRLLRSSIEMATRNGHDLWTLLFGLMEAFLYLEAGAFGHAREACLEYVSRARTLGHPLSIQMSLVLLGIAELRVGNLDAAGQRFGEISEWQSRQRILMDWIWKMPLQFGLTELWLAQGDLANARAEVDRFQSLTAATAERTWTALAHYQSARLARAEHDESLAQREISRGLAVIAGREAPLAAWRLHTLADRENAHAIIRKVAASLPDEDPLKHSCLSSIRP